uniref:Uncharacterized protein n=1 Tax=Romanomermis culicivorax TaxID=13658 RepID=A0A915JI12_ROMCU
MLPFVHRMSIQRRIVGQYGTRNTTY